VLDFPFSDKFVTIQTSITKRNIFFFKSSEKNFHFYLFLPKTTRDLFKELNFKFHEYI